MAVDFSKKEILKYSEPFYGRSDADIPISKDFLNLSRIPSELMLKIFSFLKEDKKIINDLSKCCKIFNGILKIAGFLKKPPALNPTHSTYAAQFSFSTNDFQLDELSKTSWLSDCFNNLPKNLNVIPKKRIKYVDIPKKPKRNIEEIFYSNIMNIVNEIERNNNQLNDLIDKFYGQLQNDNRISLKTLLIPDKFSEFTNKIVEAIEDWLFTIEDYSLSLTEGRKFNEVEKLEINQYCERTLQQKIQFETFIIKLFKTMELIDSNDLPDKDTFQALLISRNFNEDDQTDLATSYNDMVEQFKNFDRAHTELMNQLEQLTPPKYNFI